MVSTAWLAHNLADPDIRIFEVCSLNNDKVYRDGHIPGRVVVLLEDGLLARNRPRLHLASGHGEVVRQPWASDRRQPS
jgi:3-mercaptopyruvate sulfurtransferase SseA